ncbi:unnamed protein product [Cyprideis torosa]|uniref:Uncharacterized protein n=1 Tax=Cyprideis torosa TaxID=163714 RepID=A0A7R8WIR8_9CRUS|nr:unnamed protein product [Cyprideis torosa]CAG0901025.1 unnamed protein product [Cyprideis torosa]
MKLGDQIKGGNGATEGRRATWTDRGTRGHRSRSGSPPAGKGKEYNPEKKAPLNDKILKDKRKELRETLDPVMKLYAERGISAMELVRPPREVEGTKATGEDSAEESVKTRGCMERFWREEADSASEAADAGGGGSANTDAPGSARQSTTQGETR